MKVSHLPYTILLSISLFILNLSPSFAQKEALEEAKSLNQEVVRLVKEGKYEEAIPAAKKALMIRQNTLGPEHPDVSQSLNNLATIYNSLGDYSKAEPLFLKAHIIGEKALGPDHPRVGIIRQNLIFLYDKMGDHEKVQALKKGTFKPSIKEGPIKAADKKPPKDVRVAEATVVLKKEGSYPYSLHMGSFRTLERAKKAMAFYSTQNNLSPYWVKVDLQEKGEWFRVFYGYFKDYGQSERFKQEKGLKDSKTKKTPYACLIGVYTSDKLEDKIMSLKMLGYFPYVIEVPDGGGRLFVGVFQTRAGAEKQSNDLKSDNIESQVVTR